MDVAIVEFDRDATSAAARARASGATEIWMALPAGDARIPKGVRADPGTLLAGADGRIRFDDKGRLPLPEAFDAVLVLRDQELGGGLQALSGRKAVLAWSDPAMGLREAAPGMTRPVDRARLLAVSLGSTGRSLLDLPLPGALALVWTWSLGLSHVLRRSVPSRSWMIGGVGALLAVAAALLARRFGWDLPVGGLAFAPLFVAGVRLSRTAGSALHRLEAAVYRFGSAGDQPDSAPEFDALVAAAHLVIPEPTVAIFELGDGGERRTLRSVEGLAPLPELNGIPLTLQSGPGWLILPYRHGVSRRALAVASSSAIVPAACAYLEAVVNASGYAADEGAEDREDPFELRLMLIDRVLARAAERSDSWGRVLASLPGDTLLFDALGAPLGTLGPKGDLRSLAAELSGAEPERVRRAVSEALSGDKVVRLPAAGGGELRFVPLIYADVRVGVLLTVYQWAVEAATSSGVVALRRA